jgi:uncharacterized protein YdaU (DUF1376 family)
VNYYEHHIGDYAAATAHLSLVEDAVYSRMLRRYYMQEGPLPGDWRQVARLVGARTDEELEAVRAVLCEFFTMADDGYRQKRADEVIAAYHSKSDDRATERENEAERKRRYRERRSDLFDQLRLKGIVPAYDTPMDELVRLLSHGTDAGQVRGQDGDGTATQEPVTSNQEPEKQKHVQRAAARFPEFWAAYPVKKGKQDAEQAWRRKGLDAIADQILAHVRRMQAEDADWQDGYAPHGSTYVNGERWHDEPKRRPQQQSQQQQPSKRMQGLMALQEMKDGLAETGNCGGVPEAQLLGFGPGAGIGHDFGDGDGMD